LGQIQFRACPAVNQRLCQCSVPSDGQVVPRLSLLQGSCHVRKVMELSNREKTVIYI
jgi:hypothetical protein